MSMKTAEVLLLYCSGRKTEEASFDGMEQFKVEREVLHDILADCRAVGLHALDNTFTACYFCGMPD